MVDYDGQEIGELCAALEKILEANDSFRAGMPADWEGDPLQDAIDKARETLRRVVGGTL